jgi:hypothetical protein
MKLVVFGDSWAYGSYLQDRENSSYAKLLQEKLGATSVTNKGQSGISNFTIIRELLAWVATQDTKDTFVSIGWTSPERTDIFPDKSIMYQGAGRPFWQTIGPWIFRMDERQGHYPINYKFAKYLEFYYMNFKNQYSCYLDWIQQIILVQNTLSNLGIKYHMHQAIYNNDHYFSGKDKIQHQGIHNQEGLGGIVSNKMWNEQISSNNFLHKEKLSDMSLYGYLKNNKFTDTVFNDLGSHPNEHGHKIIAELLYKDITEKNLI